MEVIESGYDHNTLCTYIYRDYQNGFKSKKSNKKTKLKVESYD